MVEREKREDDCNFGEVITKNPVILREWKLALHFSLRCFAPLRTASSQVFAAASLRHQSHFHFSGFNNPSRHGMSPYFFPRRAVSLTP